MSSSYRDILRSSTLIGGASVINIILSLGRMKAAAVVLGPAGVGLIGIYQNLIATASTVGALGLGTSGTRQIAQANSQDDAQAVAAARRALDLGTLALAIVSSLVFWLFRQPMADSLLDDPSLATEVGWMAPAVGLGIVTGSQGALLTGLRQIVQIAQIRIWSGLFSTIAGVAALMLWGLEGMIVFLLAAPVATYVIGQFYVARLPRAELGPIQFSVMVDQWKTLVRLGTAFMLAGMIMTVGTLAVRSIVQRELGENALGQFQAAWAISMTYVSFVLSAMGTDYYPRLTASIQDSVTTNRLVNEQTEVALLLAGPVLIAMMAWCPWVIRLLYSGEFHDAVPVLRWQVLGDILKVASWPMGFVLMAGNRGSLFVACEAAALTLFVVLVWLGTPVLGVTATGVGFFGMYLGYLILMYVIARMSSGFTWSRSVKVQLFTLVACGGGLCATGYWSEWAALLLGTLACLALLTQAFVRLSTMANVGGAVGKLAKKVQGILARVGISPKV